VRSAIEKHQGVVDQLDGVATSPQGWSRGRFCATGSDSTGRYLDVAEHPSRMREYRERRTDNEPFLSLQATKRRGAIGYAGGHQTNRRG